MMSNMSEELHSEDVPDWVPPAVKSMALVLPLWGTVAKPLLTDPRMKAVWRVLQGQDVTPEALDALPSLQRMETWDLPSENVSLAEQACAAFFSRVVIEFSSPRTVATRAEANDLAKPWLDAADLCWWIMRNEFLPKIDAKFAQALATVGEYRTR